MLCYGTKRLNEFQTGNFSLKKKKKRRKKSHVCDLPVCVIYPEIQLKYANSIQNKNMLSHCRSKKKGD